MTETKVKLIDNLKYFDYEESTFKIAKGEIKTLLPREQQCNLVKFFIYTGRLLLTEGQIVFKYKNSSIFINDKAMIELENDKYFITKQAHTTRNKIEKKDLPDYIIKSLETLTIVEKN